MFPPTGNAYLDALLRLYGGATTSQTPEEMMQTPGFNPNAPKPVVGGRAQQVGGVMLPQGQSLPFPQSQQTPPPISSVPATAPGVEDVVGQPGQPTTAPAPTAQPMGTGVYSRIMGGLRDPRFQAFTLNMANRLLQTPGFGETGAQTWGQSVIHGYQGMNALSLLQQERARQARLDQMAQEKHQAEVAKTRAETGKLGAETKDIPERTGVAKGQLDINKDVAKWNREDQTGRLGAWEG